MGISKVFTIFVDGLPQNMNSNWLRKIFKSSGDIIDVYISLKKRKYTKNLFGFVRFRDKNDAKRAVANLDGKMLKSNILMVKWAMVRSHRSDNYSRIHQPLEDRFATIIEEKLVSLKEDLLCHFLEAMQTSLKEFLVMFSNRFQNSIDKYDTVHKVHEVRVLDDLEGAMDLSAIDGQGHGQIGVHGEVETLEKSLNGISVVRVPVSGVDSTLLEGGVSSSVCGVQVVSNCDDGDRVCVGDSVTVRSAYVRNCDVIARDHGVFVEDVEAGNVSNGDAFSNYDDVKGYSVGHYGNDFIEKSKCSKVSYGRGGKLSFKDKEKINRRLRRKEKYALIHEDVSLFYDVQDWMLSDIDESCSGEDEKFEGGDVLAVDVEVCDRLGAVPICAVGLEKAMCLEAKYLHSNSSAQVPLYNGLNRRERAKGFPTLKREASIGLRSFFAKFALGVLRKRIKKKVLFKIDVYIPPK